MRGSRFPAALAAVASFTVVAWSAGAQEPTTAVGFVAAVGEGTVLVSNVPIGQPGGPMTMVQRDGAPPPPPAGAATPVPSGEAKTGAAGEATAGDAPPTFTVKKADEKEAAAGKPVEAGEGKVMTLSREDAEKMKGLWVQADPNAKPAARTEGADEKVAFTEFQVTADTERPAELAPGTKVRITYTIEGEKKVARRIEIVKE